MSIYVKETGEDWVDGMRGPTELLHHMRVYPSYVAPVGEVTADDGREFVVEEADEKRFLIGDNHRSMDVEAPEHESYQRE